MACYANPPRYTYYDNTAKSITHQRIVIVASEIAEVRIIEFLSFPGTIKLKFIVKKILLQSKFNYQLQSE